MNISTLDRSHVKCMIISKSSGANVHKMVSLITSMYMDLDIVRSGEKHKAVGVAQDSLEKTIVRIRKETGLILTWSR